MLCIKLLDMNYFAMLFGRILLPVVGLWRLRGKYFNTAVPMMDGRTVGFGGLYDSAELIVVQTVGGTLS